MARVIFSAEFNGCLRDLLRAGGKGKSLVQKARAALAEAEMEGAIKQLSRTKHGESRLPDVEKYDLGDGYRLVVQLLDGENHKRAFLFCGKHDDAERWLESHRDYRWVERKSDRTLEFVQVSTSNPPVAHLPDMDLSSPASLLELPLLRDLSSENWSGLNLPSEAIQYALGVTASQYEQDGGGVLDHLQRLSSNTEQANLLLDLFDHAHKREWKSLYRRIELAQGQAIEVSGQEAADAMLEPANGEVFISWEDAKELPADQDWSEWMLFLHPEQKQLAQRDMNGPARLRGVSGSGKTCVMVHRARYLAKKYGRKVLVVTLTESMRKLLDSLLVSLCGVERNLIETTTMSGLAKNIIRDLHPQGERWYTLPRQDKFDELRRETLEVMRKHPDFDRCPLRSLHQDELRQFFSDEMSYVRSRLRPSEYDVYTTRQFKRQGRHQSLAEAGRIVCLSAIRHWDSQLEKYHWCDHESIVQAALDLVLAQDSPQEGASWRCVLVDEVQDLSQLELSLLANIITEDGERLSSVSDGLFLVGDGAQTIYKRGFRLSWIGVSVSNRSFAFSKNYRNTREILAAAYGLIRTYEFADVDEDNLSRPMEPELATRHGEKPCVVRCNSLVEEAACITTRISELISDQTLSTNTNICVIGTNQRARDAVSAALTGKKIAWAELREDAGLGSERVKVTTIESAKGHEFANVFICGLVEGVLPRFLPQEDIPREAARLYVAMTRARDSLLLTYTSNGQMRPSSFLNAIKGDCIEMTWNGKELKVLS